MAGPPGLLVGDVGGTSTRLALIGPGAAILHETRLRSRAYSGLKEPVRAFLHDTGAAATRAVFAVAGPVVGTRAQLTNLGWSLEEAELADVLGIGSVRLLNDLVAMAYAVPWLGQESLHTLQSGQPEGHGTVALVAPGTGLGEAFLTWDGAVYRAHPSEGGHADFAPVGVLQDELAAWLRNRVGHVSCERVCSGRGLPELYRFLKERGTAPETPRIARQLFEAEDPTPIILAAALAAEPCLLASAAVDLLADILAAEAGNVALRLLAGGGVYLAGGLPRRLLPVLTRPRFLERFRDKGRLSSLLSRVPLHVVTRPGLGLAGAIEYARLTADLAPRAGRVAPEALR